MRSQATYFDHRRMSRLFTAMLFSIGMALATTAQIAPLQYRTEAVCNGIKVYFTNAQPGHGQFWDFGNGVTSTSERPVHVFPYGSMMNVTLTILTGDGQTVTFAIDVTLDPPPDLSDLQFPNVFTPNGDGINDTFGPMTDQFLGPCSQLVILNRYGQKLFDGSGISVNWDGRTFAGEPATAGTYFYVFKVNGLEFTGYLSLHL